MLGSVQGASHGQDSRATGSIEAKTFDETVADAGPDVTTSEGVAATLTGTATPGSGGAVLLADDLDAYPDGSLVWPWQEQSTPPTSATISSTVFHGTSGKSLYLNDPSGSVGAGAARAIGPLAEVAVTVWVYGMTSSGGAFTLILSSSTQWAALRVGIGPGGFFIYHDCAGYSTTAIPYSDATWYELRVEASAITDTYDMYVDGALVVTQDSLCGPATDFVTVIANTGGDQVGSFYVDDITADQLQPLTVTGYRWDLDGAVDRDLDGNTTNDFDAAGPSVTVTYGDSGDFLATLTVTDSSGAKANDSALVRVENTPPWVSVAGPHVVSITTGVNLTVTVSDPGSDDILTAWLWDDGPQGTALLLNGPVPDPPLSPNGTFPFIASPVITREFQTTGTYNLTILVTDDDGGTNSTTVSIEVRGVPFTTFSAGLPRYVGAQLYVSASTPLSLSATDQSGFGIHRTYYRVDGGAVLTYSASFTVPSAGPHTIAYWSTDNLGGVEDSRAIAVFGDFDPPTISIAVNYSTSDYEFTFILEASDDESGLATLEYRIGNGNWVAYDGPVTIHGKAAVVVEARATDRVGNIGLEGPTALAAKYVNLKPVLSIVFVIVLIVAAFLLVREEDRRKRMLALLGIFGGVEGALGVASLLWDILLFPPFFGAGLVVNAVVTAVGVAAMFLTRMLPPAPPPGD